MRRRERGPIVPPWWRLRRIEPGDGLLLQRVSTRVLEAAAVLRPADLRSFDAIHLATAMQLAKELGQLVAYDDRLLRGAEQVGIKAASPQ